MAAKDATLKIRITFTEDLLGSQPADEEVFQTYIASKAPEGGLPEMVRPDLAHPDPDLDNEPDPEEDSNEPGLEETDETPGEKEGPPVEKAAVDLDKLEEKGTTIFHRNGESVLCLRDYQVKGFLKSRAAVIRERLGNEKGKAFGLNYRCKGQIDDNVFVFPRAILIHGPDGEPKTSADAILERPLKAETPRGPRVCLARSETVRAGSYIECEIVSRGVITEKVLRVLLDEGAFLGLGSWRNAGYGRFTWKELG